MQVQQRLIEDGIEASAISVWHDMPVPQLESESDETLKDMLVDGAIGTAVGTGVGAADR